MSIGSWSCPTSWEGEGGSSQRGRKRRSYGLSKARGSVSRPWLLSTSRTKTNHLGLRNRLWYSHAHLGMIWRDSAQIIPMDIHATSSALPQWEKNPHLLPPQIMIRPPAGSRPNLEEGVGSPPASSVVFSAPYSRATSGRAAIHQVDTNLDCAGFETHEEAQREGF